MAERRMFSKAIIDSDAFLDMPASAQNLYFHLGMRADDEGFVGNPRKIQRMVGASDDDMRILLGKRYILAFESGIVVIKHWYINNYIQNDRRKETTYVEEKNTLTIDEKRSYTERSKNELETQCIQNGYKLDTQNSIDKNSIGKVSIGETKITGTHTYEDFINDYPTLQEIKDFIILKDIKVDADRFYNYYSALGWKLGNTPISNWQALVLEWARKDMTKERIATIKPKRIEAEFEERKYTEDDISELFKTRDISDEEI